MRSLNKAIKRICERICFKLQEDAAKVVSGEVITSKNKLGVEVKKEIIRIIPG